MKFKNAEGTWERLGVGFTFIRPACEADILLAVDYNIELEQALAAKLAPTFFHAWRDATKRADKAEQVNAGYEKDVEAFRRAIAALVRLTEKQESSAGTGSLVAERDAARSRADFAKNQSEQVGAELSRVEKRVTSLEAELAATCDVLRAERDRSDRYMRQVDLTATALMKELDDALQERDKLKKERDAAISERIDLTRRLSKTLDSEATARAELKTASEEAAHRKAQARDAVVLDDARAQVDVAREQRDAALAERDSARAERDSAITATLRRDTVDWIPCSTQLPLAFTRVLVATDRGRVSAAEQDATHARNWRDSSGAIFRYEGVVTHWAQLPAAP